MALGHVHGTAIIPGSANVMKVFGDLCVSIVVKRTPSNAGSPFALNEKIPDKNIHTVKKKITMLFLLDPTCLIFFEHGKKGSFN
jgi:hypothetical protein